MIRSDMSWWHSGDIYPIRVLKTVLKVWKHELRTSVTRVTTSLDGARWNYGSFVFLWFFFALIWCLTERDRCRYAILLEYWMAWLLQNNLSRTVSIYSQLSKNVCDFSAEKKQQKTRTAPSRVQCPGFVVEVLKDSHNYVNSLMCLSGDVCL